MIIDDNEMDLYVGKRVMARYSFAEEVLTIDSAKGALEYLIEKKNDPDQLPDLILLDINMPEMNGFEFLDAYTSLPQDIKKNCIIMMLTTSIHIEDEQKASSNPYVRSYMNKPLDEMKLTSLLDLFKDRLDRDKNQ